MEERKPSFSIFTDYSMFRLIQDKPQHVTELRMIPGFGDYKVNKYGPPIISAIIQIVCKRKRR